MALKQPNSAAVWTESKDAGAAQPITPVSWTLNASGGLSPTNNGAIDARMLDNGAGGFLLTDGADNPSSLAELRMIDTGAAITFYE